MLTNIPTLVSGVFAIVREVRAALDAESANGKKITRDEWAKILDVAVETFRGILHLVFPPPAK